jgi:hypothetical protein
MELGTLFSVDTSTCLIVSGGVGVGVGGVGFMFGVCAMIRHKPRVSLKHTVEPAVMVAATRVSCLGIGVPGISL